MNQPAHHDYVPQLPMQIDSTIMTTYRACPKKFYYEYCLNLRPAGVSVHLHAGGAFAAAIETWRKAFYIHKVGRQRAELMGLKAYILYWGAYQPYEGSVKDFFTTMMALESYMTTYNPETDHLQPLKPGSFEYSFAIPTKTLHPNGLPFMFCGRIDLLARLGVGLPVICDEKTTTSLGAQFANKWAMRGQFLGYLWALRQIGIKSSRAYVRGTSILKTKNEHLEVSVSYPDHLINIWAEEMELTLQQMVADFERMRFQRNFGDSCTAYGTCAYQLPCSAKNESQWFSTFEQNTWNPLLRNPIAKSETELEALSVLDS